MLTTPFGNVASTKLIQSWKHDSPIDSKVDSSLKDISSKLVHL